MDRRQLAYPIDLDVSSKTFCGFGIGLEGPCSSPTHTGCQNCVASDIGADIQKQIIGSQKMEYEKHVRELVNTNVNIPRGALHAVPDSQLCSADPGNNELIAQTAFDLPNDEPQ